MFGNSFWNPQDKLSERRDYEEVTKQINNYKSNLYIKKRKEKQTFKRGDIRFFFKKIYA